MTASDVSEIDLRERHDHLYQLSIDTGIGGPITVWANIDDGVLTNAMSTTNFNTIKHHLGYCKPSPRWLRMADGSIVKPKAVWEGRMEIGSVQVYSSFEVFESGGSWEFLLGKPLLTALHAVHEYTGDTMTIENKGISAVLENQIDIRAWVDKETNEKRTTRWEKRANLKGSKETLPLREVLGKPHNDNEHMIDIACIDPEKPSEADNNQDSEPHDPSTAAEVIVETLKRNDFTQDSPIHGRRKGLTKSSNKFR